jgi:hypothetical protein
MCWTAEKARVAAVEYDNDIRFGSPQNGFNIRPVDAPVLLGVTVRVAAAERYAPDAIGVGRAVSCVVDYEESPWFGVVHELGHMQRRLQLWALLHVHALILDGKAVEFF